MDDTISLAAPLARWQGERGTYHLVSVTGEAAEAITLHERLRRLELGSRRGFGSVKVVARIGGSEWKSSVFPSKNGEWWLLVGRKVIKAEDLAVGDDLAVDLALL